VTQLALDFPHRTTLGRADFHPSACNAAALGWIERWPNWPSAALIAHGPPGSGKTHLGQVWCGRSNAIRLPADGLAATPPVLQSVAGAPAVLIDDANRAPEEALLHLYNWCAEQRTSLLLLSGVGPSDWDIRLPDLASRLRAVPAVAIAAPDDALLAAVLLKQFADRQLRVAPEVVGYLVLRMERSFAAAARLVAALDRRALRDGRPVTVPLAREILAETRG
jgi:chromosomal replication initiation ATPase DnaA